MKTVLKLSDIHHQLILEHIQSSMEKEVCGLIGGVWQGKTAITKAVIQIENISPTPAVSYRMNPQQQIRAMLDFDKRGWQVVGIYHSHPHGTTTPSPTDIRDAHYRDAVYLIGLPNGKLKAWHIMRGEVTQVEISK